MWRRQDAAVEDEGTVAVGDLERNPQGAPPASRLGSIKVWIDFPRNTSTQCLALLKNLRALRLVGVAYDKHNPPGP